MEQIEYTPKERVILIVCQTFIDILESLGAHAPAMIICIHNVVNTDNGDDRIHLLTEPSDLGKKVRGILSDIIELNGCRKA